MNESVFHNFPKFQPQLGEIFFKMGENRVIILKILPKVEQIGMNGSLFRVKLVFVWVI